MRIPGKDGWCLRSISRDFDEVHIRALVYDLNSAPKLCYPWPGSIDDISTDGADADKSALLLLMGFTPRPGVPTFAYKVKRESEVNKIFFNYYKINLFYSALLKVEYCRANSIDQFPLFRASKSPTSSRI